MDALTQKGLDFIDNNLWMLREFALAKRKVILDNPKTYGEDAWCGFDIVMRHEADARSVAENTIDINIWRDEETESWKAGAYPMEINSVGEVQTNCQDFICLW